VNDHSSAAERNSLLGLPGLHDGAASCRLDASAIGWYTSAPESRNGRAPASAFVEGSDDEQATARAEKAKANVCFMQKMMPLKNTSVNFARLRHGDTPTLQVPHGYL
jgi:hypothetical protein